MRTYTERKHFISSKEIALLDMTRYIIEYLPDFEQVVSCHVLCKTIAVCHRAQIARTPQALQWKSGFFESPGWNHSWLITPEENIIDAYPWAQIGGPVLLCTKFFSPWRFVFHEANLPDLEDREFHDHFNLVYPNVERIMKQWFSQKEMNS